MRFSDFLGHLAHLHKIKTWAHLFSLPSTPHRISLSPAKVFAIVVSVALSLPLILPLITDSTRLHTTDRDIRLDNGLRTRCLRDILYFSIRHGRKRMNDRIQ